MRIFFLILFLTLSGPAFAEKSVPVKITSDSMRYSQKNDQVVFTGAVHVIRQDVELWSDTLTVFLEKSTTAAGKAEPALDQQSSIKRITAQGNVRFKADRDRSGTCGKATYEAKSELLTLEDKPILREGPNTIQGEIIKLYIEENRSEVIGGKKRVEAIFITPDRKPGSKQ
jgi:lipopolysaccharide export system protein LptA